MTALALDTPRAYELGETNTLPVRASTCIYEGAAVGDDASGYARGLVAGDEFRGFCIKQADNSATATNGAINVQVRSTGKAQLAVTSLAIDSVGAQVFASDDATFTLESGDGTNSYSYIGTVYRYVSAGVGIVSFAAKGDRDDKSVTLGMMVDLARGSIISGQTDGNRPTALVAKNSGRILIGNGTDLTSAEVTGDVTISATGVTTIGEGKVESSMLANGAGVAGLLGAGLGGSVSVEKTDTGAKTIIEAHGTKDRACLVLVTVDDDYAGTGTPPTVKIGEEGSIEKCMDGAVLDTETAGTVLAFAFTNTAGKKIIVTTTAATGDATGGCSITVLAIPTTPTT